MKNLVVRTLASLSFAVLFLAGSMHAQYSPRAMKVNVPFEFSIGDRVFPSGDYSFVRTGPKRLDLRDADYRVVASLLTMSTESPIKSAKPKLVFSTENGGLALVRVWLDDEHVGYAFAQPKSNVALAKQDNNNSVHVAAGSR
jgi:hypothetical protein